MLDDAPAAVSVAVATSARQQVGVVAGPLIPEGFDTGIENWSVRVNPLVVCACSFFLALAG